MKIYGYVDSKCSEEVKEGIYNLSCKVYNDLDVLLGDIDKFTYGDILVLRNVNSINKFLYKELATKGVALRLFRGVSTNLTSIKVFDDVIELYISENDTLNGGVGCSLSKLCKDLGIDYKNLTRYIDVMFKYSNWELYTKYVNVIKDRHTKLENDSDVVDGDAVATYTKDLLVNVCNFCRDNNITFSGLSDIALLLDKISLDKGILKMDNLSKVDNTKKDKDLLYLDIVKNYVETKKYVPFYAYCKSLGVPGSTVSGWVHRCLKVIDEDLFKRYKCKVNTKRRGAIIDEKVKLQILNEYINSMNSLSSLCNKHEVPLKVLSKYIHGVVKVRNVDLYKKYIDVRNKKVKL